MNANHCLLGKHIMDVVTKAIKFDDDKQNMNKTDLNARIQPKWQDNDTCTKEKHMTAS